VDLAPIIFDIIGNLDHPCESGANNNPRTFSDSTHGNGGTKSTRLNLNQSTVEKMPLALLDCAEDEMDLKRLVKLVCFFRSIDWGTNDLALTRLYSFAVSPTWFWMPVGPDAEVTNLAYLANPFTFWRGDMRLIVNVVSTAFHRGRLAIVFVPGDTTGTLAWDDVKSNPQFDVDIEETREFELNIPFYSNTFYKNVAPVVGGATFDLLNSTGHVYIFVLNKLTANSSVPGLIYLNLKVAAGDNFEVMYPRHVEYLIDETLPTEPELQSGNTTVRDDGANVGSQEASKKSGAMISAPLVWKPLAENHMNLQEMLRRPFARGQELDVNLNGSDWKHVLTLTGKIQSGALLSNFLRYFSVGYRFFRGPIRYWIWTNASRTDKITMLVRAKPPTRDSDDTTIATIPFQTDYFSYSSTLTQEPCLEVTVPYININSKVVAHEYGPITADYARYTSCHDLEIAMHGDVLGSTVNLFIMNSLADESRFSYYLGPPKLKPV
jgi:hypothetical protein